MLNIPITFSTDKQSKMDYKLRETIASHDINSVRFEITFKDVDLTGKTVKVLSKYPNGSQIFVQCEIEEDKAILWPETDLISGSGVVHNYVYLYEGNTSLDVREFKYDTKLSEIDKSSEVIRKVYDKSYADLLSEFELALTNYRDGLPSGSEIRLEIDTILNQFRLDSTAKLLEYDTQAQDMLTANQSLFTQAETDRQNTYSQSESLRDTSTSQAITGFEQTADESLDTKISEIQADADEVITQTVADFNVRADVAVDNKLQQFDDTTGVVLSEIEDSEALRVAAENGRQALIDGKADRFVLKNLIPIKSITTTGYGTTTGIVVDFLIGNEYYTSRDLTIKKGVDNGVSGRVTDLSGQHLLTNALEHSKVLKYLPTSGDGISRMLTIYGVIDGEVLFDNLTLINLTQTFGAGNEPTKAEMDTLIKITGYFDKISLTTQQMLNWQLKLMRQNRNAIIALGGTLI